MRITLLVVVILLSGCAGVESKYQADMDKIRISHIDSFRGLMDEYAAKSNSLPLQSEIKSQDIQVFITHRKLPKWLVEQSEQLSVETYSRSELEQDLEAVLGRDINLPTDPQNVETFAPNLYIYQVTKNWACVAGHLYSQTPKTKNIQNRYHKYELCLKS